jgi:hypothetical protein
MDRVVRVLREHDRGWPSAQPQQDRDDSRLRRH